MNNIVCFLDTEFNALDLPGQNDGFQEITEIGAVIFSNGKIIDKFSRYCRLKKGHKLSKKCKRITGIDGDILNKNGIPFNEAIMELISFLSKNKVSKIYAFGPADAMEMRHTAKLNNADKTIYNFINKIKNVYPIFENILSLHYIFSLTDICRICRIDHEKDNRAHSALNDAEDTGLAFYNMKRGHINKQLLNELNTHKNNVRIYRNNRSVCLASIKSPGFIDSDFIEKLDTVFENAQKRVSKPVIQAIHDDMMRIIGRPDLEIGKDGL